MCPVDDPLASSKIALVYLIVVQAFWVIVEMAMRTAFTCRAVIEDRSPWRSVAAITS